MSEETYYDRANGHRLKPIETRNGKVLCQDVDAGMPTRILCRRDEISILHPPYRHTPQTFPVHPACL